MPWPSCSPYRQNTPTGAQRCPKAYATAPRPRHSKPWSTSISMLSQTSTCRADTDATEKGTMKHHKGLASFNPNQRRLSVMKIAADAAETEMAHGAVDHLR